MSNAERLLRELRNADRRGCTHRELEGAGVAFVSVEIDRARAHGAVIREDRLPVSHQKRYVLLVEPDVGRAVNPASAAVDEGSGIGSSPNTGLLFDPPAAPAASPYDDVEAA